MVHRIKKALPLIAIMTCASFTVSCANITEPTVKGLAFPDASEKAITINCITDDCAGSIAYIEGIDPSVYKSVRTKNGVVLPSQWVDSNMDGIDDKLYFIAGEKAAEYYMTALAAPMISPKVQTILSTRTGAQWEEGKLRGGEFVDSTSLDVPAWHKPGTNYLRYEGPAWESELVGYRLYLDERNGTDIFGKRINKLALHEHGGDGDNYHQLQDWGADILKVGESLGIGAPGIMTDQGARRIKASQGISYKLLDKGPLVSRFQVDSKGWMVHGSLANIQTQYGIMAGSRLTEVNLSSDVPITGLVTGLVNHKDKKPELIRSKAGGDWGYIAMFGKQSFFEDNLGTAIFYRTADAKPIDGDAYNELIAFKGSRKNIQYYFSAVWAQDIAGINSIEEFMTYLEAERKRLSNPLVAKNIK